jgi:hypothetical protein
VNHSRYTIFHLKEFLNVFVRHTPSWRILFSPEVSSMTDCPDLEPITFFRREKLEKMRMKNGYLGAQQAEISLCSSLKKKKK